MCVCVCACVLACVCVCVFKSLLLIHTFVEFVYADGQPGSGAQSTHLH